MRGGVKVVSLYRVDWRWVEKCLEQPCESPESVYFWGVNNWVENKLAIIKGKKADEGLTLETSAFLPFTVANLHFQLNC